MSNKSIYIPNGGDKYIKLSQALEVLDSCSCWYAHDRMEMIPAADVIDANASDAIRDEGIKIGAELAAMHGSDATTQELEKEYWHGYEDAMQRRDIKPVVHGKWVLKTFDDGYGEYQLYECNLCGAVTAQRKSKNYCHNCGAKMESEGEQ